MIARYGFKLICACASIGAAALLGAVIAQAHASAFLPIVDALRRAGL